MRRSSRVFLFGVVLLVFGLGNVMMGASKMTDYDRKMGTAVAKGGPEVTQPFRGTGSILEPITDAHLRYESASLKYDYYRVVHRGGRLLTILGCVLAGGAVIRRIFVPAR